MLIHGLGVSYQVFNPLIEHLQSHYRIIAVQVDGFLIDEKDKAIPSVFTSIDDQVDQLVQHILTKYDGHIDAAYGLSMGGCIVAKLQERADITIDHVILDAAPLVPLPRWSIDPLRYYQSFNVWCSYYMSGFFKCLFRSHYFDTLLDELAKVYPSGYGRAVRDAYKSIYTSRLEQVRSTDVHYWYGQHEAFVAKYMFSHLESLAPHCRITRFPRMQHGQLVIDHPDRVAQMLVDVVG
jgi:pimeloyl-ACP methyl ester carboxylesterase